MQERQLWCAVLERAILDAVNGESVSEIEFPANTGLQRRYDIYSIRLRISRDYILKRTKDFVAVCALADMDPEAVAKHTEQIIKERGVTPELLMGFERMSALDRQRKRISLKVRQITSIPDDVRLSRADEALSLRLIRDEELVQTYAVRQKVNRILPDDKKLPLPPAREIKTRKAGVRHLSTMLEGVPA